MGEAPGRPGMGEGTASAQAPEAGDRLPPPNPMFDAYPCVTPPAAPQPKVRLTTAEERYDVRGRTAAELTAAMRAALGPGHGPGRTTGEVRASCTYRQEGHLCTPLCSAVVTLRVTLPRWDERGPAELVERWRRFVARVQTHEASHRHLFVAEGNELVKQLGELPRTPCKEVERTVELHSAVLRDQQKQKHRAYDETCKADPSCRLEL